MQGRSCPTVIYSKRKSDVPMAVSALNKRRLSRSDWLAQDMEVLSKKGEARLTIDKLCLELGVTKGSFYAHFEDRADFVRQFVAHWAEQFTQTVVTQIDKLTGEPADARLLALMLLLKRKRLARYDIAIRSWAAHDPIVARGVARVDRQRFDYIRGLFQEIGFRGAELDLRVRLFVVYHSLEPGMNLPRSVLAPEDELKLRHQFFTRT